MEAVISATYNGVPGNVSASASPAITIPVDGDLANAASVTTAMKTLADTVGLIETAMTSAFWFGGASTTADTTARYCTPGAVVGAISTTELYLIVPKAGKCSQMYIVCTTGSTTQGWTVFIRKNTANTTVTQTVGAAALTGSDLVNSFSVAAGDKLSVSLTGVSGITVAPVNFAICFLYTMA